MESPNQSQNNAGGAKARALLAFLALALAAGVLAPSHGARAAQVSSRSDALSNSQPSATSNHTISFTTNTAIYGSSVSNSSTLGLMFPADFNTPSTLDCGDIDAATGSQFNFNYPGCAPTATAWGMSVTNAISFVQTNAGNAGAAQYNSTAFNTNNTAGNLIVLVANWDDTSASVLSVTDTVGNVYASALGPVDYPAADPNMRTQIFYAKNIKGGPNTVTVKLSSAAPAIFEVWLHEYSGADTVSPLDAVSVSSGPAGITTAMNSGTSTTHLANELIFGFGATNAVSSPGAGFTIRSTFDVNMSEDKTVSLIGSYNASETAADTSGSWVMMMATFKAASSITLVPPSDTAVHVATGTPITIKIGSNATVGQQGAHWITNPSTPGVYTISVGGTFGGSGNIPVSINAGQTVQATVAENLSFTVSSVAATAPPYIYVQTATAGTTNNFSCDGVTASGFLRQDRTIQQGGTPASSQNTLESANSTKNIDASFISPSNDPGLTNWASGNWVVRLNVTASGSLDTWTGTCIFRVDAAGTTNLATVGSLTGQSIGLGSIGVYTMTVSGSSLTTNATDRFYIEIVIHGGALAGSTAKFNQNVDTPLAAPGNCSADDGATVNAITTTATSVPFGFISPNTFYQGCQDLTVSTNALGGYSLTVQESHAMQTANGLYSILDTTCDAANYCSVATATTWMTPTNYGLGLTCHNQTGSDCNASYVNGTKFKPLPNVPAGTIPGTISFVQGNAGLCNGASCTSTTIPFTSNNTAGNLIVVAFDYPDSVSLLSVTDTLGNAYVRAGTEIHSGWFADIYYAKNIKGGANAVTVTLSGAAIVSSLEVYIHEYSGLDPNSPLDVTAGNTGSDTNMDSGPATTNFANELIFGVGFANIVISPGAGFTSRLIFNGNMTEDKIVSAAGAYDATETGDGSNWSMQMATFRASNTPVSLMSNSGPVASSTGRAKYRLSVSPNQPAGTYTTVIMYTILGTF